VRYACQGVPPRGGSAGQGRAAGKQHDHGAYELQRLVALLPELGFFLGVIEASFASSSHRDNVDGETPACAANEVADPPSGPNIFWSIFSRTQATTSLIQGDDRLATARWLHELDAIASPQLPNVWRRSCASSHLSAPRVDEPHQRSN